MTTRRPGSAHIFAVLVAATVCVIMPTGRAQGAMDLVPVDAPTATSVASGIGGASSFHPMLPWNAYGPWGFDVGVDLLASGFGADVDGAYAGDGPPSLLGGRIHVMFGLPMEFDAGVMMGHMNDLQATTTVTRPDGERIALGRSGWSLFGVEGRWMAVTEEKLVPAVGLRLAATHAIHGRGSTGIDATTIEVDAGVSKALFGIWDVHGGLGGLLTLPHYGDRVAEGDSVIPAVKLTIGTGLNLAIFRILAEVDLVNITQGNFGLRLSGYW